ncbi:hypothetical protein SLA2020_256100 [Shorea laevis]
MHITDSDPTAYSRSTCSAQHISTVHTRSPRSVPRLHSKSRQPSDRRRTSIQLPRSCPKFRRADLVAFKNRPSPSLVPRSLLKG